MTRSLYLIGGPGCGKSTLMARLLAHWVVGPNVRVTPKELFGHCLARDRETGLYLGVIRAQFPGTDGLSMSVNRYAVPWASDAHETGRYDLILGEGGRLANRPFLTALRSTTQLLLVNLVADFDAARQRTLSRPDDGGWKSHGKRADGTYGGRVDDRPQSDQHLRSGASKSANLAAEYQSVTIDTTDMTPEEVEETLCLIY